MANNEKHKVGGISRGTHEPLQSNPEKSGNTFLSNVFGRDRLTSASNTILHQFFWDKKDTPSKITPNLISNPASLVRNDLSSVISVFGNEKFDKKKYCNNLFENCIEEQIRDQLGKIVSNKSLITRRLQESVHNNYPLFINSSQEISNLETDIFELRNSFNEFSALFKRLQMISFNFGNSALPEPLSQSTESSNLLKDIERILDVPNQLDILVSERLFEASVEYIENVIQMNESSLHAILFRTIRVPFEQSIQILADMLFKDLQNPNVTRTESRILINYLIRLGFTKKTREFYLETVAKKIRRDIFEPMSDTNYTFYINEISHIVFSAINSTFDDLNYCFVKDMSMTSEIVIWTINQIRYLMFIFAKHVFSSHFDDFQLLRKCLEVTLEHCKVLKDLGLSLAFYVEQSLQTTARSMLHQYIERMESTLSNQIIKETWKLKPITANKYVWCDVTLNSNNPSVSPNENIQISESCQFLVEGIACKLMSDIITVASHLDMEMVFKSIFLILLEKYITQLSNLMVQVDLKLDLIQQLSLVKNVCYLKDYTKSNFLVDPNNTDSLYEKTCTNQKGGEAISQPNDQLSMIYKKIEQVEASFASRFTRSVVKDTLEWSSDSPINSSDNSYTINELSENNPIPSPNVIKAVQCDFFNLKKGLAKCLYNQSHVEDILRMTWKYIFSEIAGGLSSKESQTNQLFGDCVSIDVLNQFVLDIRFLMEAAKMDLTSKVTNNIHHENGALILALEAEVKQLIEQFVSVFCKTSTAEVKSENWTKNIIEKTLGDISKL